VSSDNDGTAEPAVGNTAAGLRRNPLVEFAEAAENAWFDGELASVRKVAADVTAPLQARLDALEDLAESDVGDTLLVRARNIERQSGLRQIYLKFDGDNPTGSQKHRIAFAQARDALRRGYTGVTLASCGNYGAAMAFATDLCGLDCTIVVPCDYHTRRIAEMQAYGAEVLREGEDYESAVAWSKEFARERELYDANPGGDNVLIQLDAYREIAYEIYDQLRDAPAVVAVPVSNGTTLSGIHRGFASLFRRGKTSRMPRIVAGSAYNMNPIVEAYQHKLPRAVDLPAASIRETETNEPLINWHAIDGDHALRAIRETNGWADDASDKAMKAMAKVLRESQGLHVLPASTAGLIALLQRHAKEPLPPDRYVVVLTGRAP